MPSLEYLKALGYDATPIEKICDEIKSDPLRSVARVLVENFHRLHALASLPPNLVSFYCALQLAYTKMVYEATQSWDSILGSHLGDKEQDVIKRMSNFNQPLGVAGQLMPPEIACFSIDFAHEMNGNTAKIGIEAILHSQILAAWTALEAVLQDAWVTALNHGPKSISKNVLERNKALRPVNDEAASSKNSDKLIPIKCLSEYGYDLRNRMGDLLYDQGKVDFTCLNNAARAYNAAFGKDVSDLINGDTPRGEDIRMMEAIRNLLAHQAGIVDIKFIRNVASLKKSTLSTDLSGLAVKKALPITASMVGHLNACAIATACDVLRAVDARISQLDNSDN